jgi:hypothetical protein
VPVFSFLRTVAMNLLRRAGYRSIRQGFRELAYDIRGRIIPVQSRTNGGWARSCAKAVGPGG